VETWNKKLVTCEIERRNSLCKSSVPLKPGRLGQPDEDQDGVMARIVCVSYSDMHDQD
jgi:hypothetical protein